MTKKNLMISEMLRNWYFIDSVLLNEHAKKIITDDKDYQEYLSLKSAMLSDLYEFYNYIGYTPKGEIPKSTKALQEQAVISAKKTKSVSARMIENADFKSQLKRSIMLEFDKNSKQDINKLSDKIINERFLKMSLDNILVGVPIIECKNQNLVADFKSNILEQAYLTVRSEMIRIASKYNPALKKNITETAGALLKAGLLTWLGFTIAGATARMIERFQGNCENRCGVARFDTMGKKICGLKCKIAVHQKIIAELRRGAGETNNPEAREKLAKDVRRAQMRIAQYQRQIAAINAKRPAGAENPEAGAAAKVL